MTQGRASGATATEETELPPGVNICFDGANVVRGQVGDVVMVWKDRGEIKQHLLRMGDHVGWEGEAGRGSHGAATWDGVGALS